MCRGTKAFSRELGRWSSSREADVSLQGGEVAESRALDSEQLSSHHVRHVGLCEI